MISKRELMQRRYELFYALFEANSLLQKEGIARRLKRNSEQLRDYQEALMDFAEFIEAQFKS